MLSDNSILQSAKRTLENEADAILSLKNYLGISFVSVVRLILKSKGIVMITGIGKSAIIANKMVATLNSTGTPAVFIHAADAIHGDLGIVRKRDIVICISKSGNSPEIKVLLPILKKFGCKLIALTGNIHSYLAKRADYILNASVEKEAESYNLVPTCSTTACLALGDALAICLLETRGFTAKDFAKFHPGGQLGKQLYLKVKDLILHNQLPVVNSESPVKKVILEITSKRLGATAVIDSNGSLTGIITDGDLRRMLEKYSDLNTIRAKDIMNPNPKTIDSACFAVEALEMIKNNNITQLIVTKKKKLEGLVHVHDLIREGLM